MSVLKIIVLCILTFGFPSKVFSAVLPYDYSSTEYYIIKLSPTEPVSTKDNITEGEIIQFRVCDDVYVKGLKFLQKDDIVNAKIETIVQPGWNGMTAELTIDSFEIPNTAKSQLISEYTKQGNNKFWVKFFKFVIPPPVSMLPYGRFIKGGHAKIKTNDVIIVKYFPDWK